MSGNKAIIVSAPSGSGKTTIVKHLLKKFPALKFSISATTREKRENETDKSDYYFFNRKEFLLKVNNDEFVEWEEVYNGSLYGTLKSEVERIWSEGNYIIFDVDVRGAINLKDYFQENGLSLFIRVKDISVLEKRLRLRGTETEESLHSRIDKASSEMGFESYFDHIIINDKLKLAQMKAVKIVESFLKL
jgi:guanylate kinase